MPWAKSGAAMRRTKPRAVAWAAWAPGPGFFPACARLVCFVCKRLPCGGGERTRAFKSIQKAPKKTINTHWSPRSSKTQTSLSVRVCRGQEVEQPKEADVGGEASG